jgi:hypothetical protein
MILGPMVAVVGSFIASRSNAGNQRAQLAVSEKQATTAADQLVLTNLRSEVDRLNAEVTKLRKTVSAVRDLFGQLLDHVLGLDESDLPPHTRQALLKLLRKGLDDA